MPRSLLRSIALLGCALGAAGLPAAWAHYPMLEADQAEVAPGQQVTVEFGVGHPYANDRFRCDKPLTAQVFRPSGEDGLDLMSGMVEAGSPAIPRRRFSFTPDKEGDWVVSVRSLFSEPPQRQIEDFTKLVVHVPGSQRGWDRVVGDPLEIVPLTRPYSLPVGATFRGRVLEHGQAFLDGAVEAETYAHTNPVEPFPDLATYRRWEKTDPTGCFAITLDQPGWWLLSVATDGGPGFQGGSSHPIKRAVLWLHVGAWDPAQRRAFAPAPGTAQPPSDDAPADARGETALPPPPALEPPSWGLALIGWALLLAAGVGLLRLVQPALPPPALTA